MVLDATLLNTQYYKIQIKGKVKQSRERSSALPDTLQVALGNFIDQVGRVLTNGLGDQGLIPGWVTPKIQKMIPDTALLNTQYYKIQIKGKVEQSRERSSALPYTFKLSLATDANFTYIYMWVSYNNWCLYTSIASNKAFIRWRLWVQAWFKGPKHHYH